MSEANALGAFLRARRKDLGLTLRQVERAADGKLSNALLSQIETGKVKSPGFETVMVIAAAYGLDAVGLYRLSRGQPYEMPDHGICPTCGRMS